jgi:hypothetical protein
MGMGGVFNAGLIALKQRDHRKNHELRVRKD